MLKHLNGIAAGLLGLHGYPVEPISSAACTSPAPADPASRRSAATSLVTEVVARERASHDAALHC